MRNYIKACHYVFMYHSVASIAKHAPAAFFFSHYKESIISSYQDVACGIVERHCTVLVVVLLMKHHKL